MVNVGSGSDLWGGTVCIGQFGVRLKFIGAGTVCIHQCRLKAQDLQGQKHDQCWARLKYWPQVSSIICGPGLGLLGEALPYLCTKGGVWSISRLFSNKFVLLKNDRQAMKHIWYDMGIHFS